MRAFSVYMIFFIVISLVSYLSSTVRSLLYYYFESPSIMVTNLLIIAVSTAMLGLKSIRSTFVFKNTQGAKVLIYIAIPIYFIYGLLTWNKTFQTNQDVIWLTISVIATNILVTFSMLGLLVSLNYSSQKCREENASC